MELVSAVIHELVKEPAKDDMPAIEAYYVEAENLLDVTSVPTFELVRSIRRHPCNTFECSTRLSPNSRTQLCMSSTTIIPDDMTKTDDDYFHNKTSDGSGIDFINNENDIIITTKEDTDVSLQRPPLHNNNNNNNNGVMMKDKRVISKRNRVLLQLNQDLK